METNSILSANILDILFEGRNKEYGAYDLRNTYNKRIGASLGVTALVVFLFIATAFWKGPDSVTSISSTGIVFKPENPDPKVDIIPPKKMIKQDPVKSVRNTPPLIVIDNDVIEPPIENDKLTGLTIDTKTVDGRDEIGIIPPAEIKGSQVLEAPKKIINDETPFTSVEIEAKFNGNWNSYVQKEIEKNIDELTEAGVSGTCVVKFVVSIDGNVNNVEAVTMKGTKLAEVAVNAIRKGPKWIPAIQNGMPVNAYRQQPVTFKITE